jgi:hypothetical protein
VQFDPARLDFRYNASFGAPGVRDNCVLWTPSSRFQHVSGNAVHWRADNDKLGGRNSGRQISRGVGYHASLQEVIHGFPSANYTHNALCQTALAQSQSDRAAYQSHANDRYVLANHTSSP